MAYGARLESVLGASPRGFESPILRKQAATDRQKWRAVAAFLYSRNEKRLFVCHLETPPCIAMYRQVPPRRGTFGGTISEREGVLFTRRL